ncbi:MAG: lamin tail domain-containing protein [Chloroflexota bacterium]
MKVKRLIYYLLINVFISSCTTLLVLQAWAWSRPPGGSPPPGEAGAVLTGIAANPGGNLSLPTGSGIVVITQVITAPPEAFTPYPTRGIVTYRVKEGDTISGVALYFDVDAAALMALNDMGEGDYLLSGVDILIPPPRTPTLTPTEGPTDTPTLTPTPFASPTPRFTATPTGPTPTPGLIVSAVFGAGDIHAERVELRLGNGGELVLSGWQIRDEDGNQFTFPQLVLRSGGQISVYTRAGEASVTALYWGLADAIWESGETVTVVDTAGNERATFVLP